MWKPNVLNFVRKQDFLLSRKTFRRNDAGKNTGYHPRCHILSLSSESQFTSICNQQSDLQASIEKKIPIKMEFFDCLRKTNSQNSAEKNKVVFYITPYCHLVFDELVH